MDKSLIMSAVMVAAAFGTVGLSASGQETGTAPAPFQNPKISLEQAIRVATERFKGRVTESELDSEGGRLMYEIEIEGDGRIEHEVEVDAMTGEIVSVGSEDRPSGVFGFWND